MPKHTLSNVDVVVCNALIIRLVDIMHMYKRITQFILSAIDECADYAINALVAHCVHVHGQAVRVSLARQLRNLLFCPVDDALMTVRIQRLNKSCAGFHSAVYEYLNPVRFYVVRGVFLRVNCLSQSLICIHPAFNSVGHA